MDNVDRVSTVFVGSAIVFNFARFYNDRSVGNGSAGKQTRVFSVAIKSGIEIIVEGDIVIIRGFYIFLRGFRGGRRRGGRVSR